MIARIFILIIGLFCLCRCQWQHEVKPSVLVIAVDSLSSDLITCLDESEVSNSGFATLCGESVRFTHAYTTSLMGVAALSSILTAQYPYETRLTNNGSNYLTNEVQTAAEIALKRDYRTAFYSGGPPIFRKSGLGQGFEVFEDNIPVSVSEAYRPISQSLEILQQWIDKDVKSKSFFSVVFASDLQFPNEATKNNLGEARAKTLKSQIQEIDESLFDFFNYLKKINRWDSTYIILVGLNGYSSPERTGELPGTNLYSENTQVSLLIKPPTKKRDYGLRWKIDENVSLVDVGATLFDILGQAIPLGIDRLSPALSLQPMILDSSIGLERDRTLVIESGWPAWRESTETRYVFQKEQYLILFDQVPKVFNNLVDRQQLVPIGNSESTKLFDEISEFTKSQSIQLWPGLSSLAYRKYRLSRHLWRGRLDEFEQEELRLLVDAQKTKSDVVRWAAYLAVERRDWTELARLARKFSEEEWDYVAKINLGQKTGLKQDSCLRALLVTSVKVCEDSFIQDFKMWLVNRNEAPSVVRERFMRVYRKLIIDRRILQSNYSNGYLWDSNQKGVLELGAIDLFLALPENQKLKVLINEGL